MDEPLHNSLWNLLCRWYAHVDDGYGGFEQWGEIAELLAEGFWKERIDEVPTVFGDRAAEWVKTRFFAASWYEVYDLIEFLVGNSRPATVADPKDMPHHVNEVLEREGAGYRFIQGELTEITSEGEVEEVTEAIGRAESHGLRVVSEHIRAALRLLRRKPEADYRNATKEAISAVESTVKLITGSRGTGLKDALDELGKVAPLHGAFRDGFLKLYGYTSDGDGIRHALLEESDLGFDEAKFMVVTCSAACNLLIAKADAAGALRPSG